MSVRQQGGEPVGEAPTKAKTTRDREKGLPHVCVGTLEGMLDYQLKSQTCPGRSFRKSGFS
jgi:hypothetical protein